MYQPSTAWGEVDEQGRLILPPEVARAYGMTPGSRTRIVTDGGRLQLHRPVTQLTQVYVEPTNRCNISCLTCMRNNWELEMGLMSQETFDQILDEIKGMDPIPTVFFGGLGEPLFNRNTIRWIAQAKAAGARVEMISNGTMLDEKRTRAIIDADLDRLWISLDGATPQSYADVRLGAELPKVLENLRRLSRMRKPGHFPKPELGIAFVAMASNIAELPELLQLARQLRAKQFMVSNVLPYTEALLKERLYTRTVRDASYMDSPFQPKLNLPRMDHTPETGEALLAAFRSGFNITWGGSSLAKATDVCSFIENGTLSVAWDGRVSPCPKLLHSHTSYLHDKPHFSREHIVGRVGQQPLMEMWLEPEFVAYRERVHRFAFAPCTFCGGCDLSEANEEDCFGNEFPACGGCLWAQGVIQCP